MTDTERLPSMQALGEQLRELADSETRDSPPARSMRRGLAVVGAALLIVAGAVTPPGQAVAERLGELVGIGDEPTELGGRTAVVIGTGESRAYPYEIVATSDAPNMIQRPGEPPVVCISVEFPNVSGVQVANCLNPEVQRALSDQVIEPIVYAAPEALFPDAELIVQGAAVPEVETVRVTYRTVDGALHESLASVSFLGGELSDQIGVDDETRFFVAFIPTDVLEPPETDNGPLSIENAKQALADVQLTALDAEGNVLVSTDLDRSPNEAERLAGLLAPTVRFAGSSGLAAPPPAEVAPGGAAVDSRER